MLGADGKPVGGEALFDRYHDDTEHAIEAAEAANVPFVLASPPAPHLPGDVWEQLDSVYRLLAASHPRIQYADAGVAISPVGEFVDTQRCLPFEQRIPQAREACDAADGVITVRGSDGHFCPVSTTTGSLECTTYSRGRCATRSTCCKPHDSSSTTRPRSQPERSHHHEGSVVKTESSSTSAMLGSAIGLYAVFDTLILGLPILVLAVRFNPLAVFGIAVLSVFLLNVACCTWVDANWGLFAAGPGGRVEARIQKLRARKSLEKPIGWITNGSAAELRARSGGDQRDPRRGDGARRDRFAGRGAAHPHCVAHLRVAVLGGLLLLRICTGKGHRPALSGCECSATRPRCLPARSSARETRGG